MTTAVWTLTRDAKFYASVVLTDGRARVSLASDAALVDRFGDALGLPLDGFDPVDGPVTVTADRSPERVSIWVDAYVQLRSRTSGGRWDITYKGPVLFGEDVPLPAGVVY